MGAKDGRVYSLFLATAAPTTATDSSDAAYAEVLLVRSHNLAEVIAAIDITTKDDGDNSAYTGGRADRDINVSCLLDTAAGTGQTKLKTAIAAAGHGMWFLLTSDVTGDIEWYGQAVPTNRTFDFPDGAPATLDFTLKVNGAITEAVIS